jgi:large subunit ribosomal protein L19
MDLLRKITESEIRTDMPELTAGDIVRVHYRIQEGNKSRIQAYEGTVISVRGGGLDRTFTVRKISFTVGVERVFPYSSPHIEKVEVLQKSRVRRAKLYYLRDLRGRAARLKPLDTAKRQG